MNITKIMNFRNKYNIDIIDYVSGVLNVNGKNHRVIALHTADTLSDALTASLKQDKGVIKIGYARYKYAPEITRTIIYIKQWYRLFIC